MIDNPIRRGQLIAPFGVGAMVVAKNGTSMVTAGLDFWYRRENDQADPSEDSLREFKVAEWRLERRLGVSHFRLPPDWRESRDGQGVPNPYLSVPFLKFPTWYSCRKCSLMHQSEPTERTTPQCSRCQARGWYGRMVQVPIVAVCRQGHLMEFPWRQWAHRTAHPTCTRSLQLFSVGGATLASKLVSCECGAKRSLSGVTSSTPDGQTTLTSTLTDTPFLCRGERAWIGEDSAQQPCNSPVQGSLRNALNVYYADVQSAIFLPIGSGSVPLVLMDAIYTEVQALTAMLEGLPLDHETMTQHMVRLLIQKRPPLEVDYGRDVLLKAVSNILRPEAGASGGAEQQFEDEVVFRHEEHLALQTERREDDLKTRLQKLEDYGPLSPFLSSVTLAEKIKETRVLNGFTRVYAPDTEDFAVRQAMMWLEPPPRSASWLPAQVVYGEGIYLTLNTERLAAWEEQSDVRNRVAKLALRAGESAPMQVTPRLVLLHTLSHLLMNQLTFSCGYSSATLKERLYASSEELTLMAGILIYTAEGDSDGTLGGLVRMGQGANFSAVFEQALLNAAWCSADPVCMEAGEQGGQGPGSLNLAACHSCALVPETACELFNRLLDRGLVVGTPEQPELGFFSDLLIANIRS